MKNQVKTSAGDVSLKTSAGDVFAKFEFGEDLGGLPRRCDAWLDVKSSAACNDGAASHQNHCEKSRENGATPRGNFSKNRAKFEFATPPRQNSTATIRAKNLLNAPAFTLIELVFVIVIAGLLGAFIAPKFAQNKPLAAAEQLASHIRYAQYLALTNDRFNASRSDWQRTWWIVEFSHINTQRKVNGVCENVQCWRYNVYADDTGSTNLNSIRQAAPDPLAPGKRLTAGFSPGSMTADAIAALNLRLNLTHAYGIERVLFRGGCTTYGDNDEIGLKLRFDELGRVYGANVRKAYDGALAEACNVLLYGGGGRCAKVVIEAQTGFVRVADGC